MAAPTPYDRLYNFTDWQTVNPTKPLPATELDAELNALELTTDEIRGNLALIQRDDGKLANQVVTPESLSAGALAMISQGEYLPRGAWAGTTVYAVGDVVEYNLATYLCLIAHTAAPAFPTDLAAGRWLLIANGALTGGAAAVDLFEGTGAQTAFTLSINYANSNAATVFVGGVAQIPTQQFTISGNTLTFVVAPPAPSVPGNKNVMVRGTGVEVQLASSAATQAASDAMGYAASALASENNAAASAATALSGADTATTQAGIATTGGNTATTQAGIATTQAGIATTQAGAAATQASNAATSANTATTQAGNAATSASTATTQAGIATTQAGIATTQAGIATTQASNALTSANNAAASFDSFDDRYLGAKASNPTLDNDGAALLTGALYWNSVSSEMRVWTGAAWAATYLPAANYVAKTGDTLTGNLTVPSLNTGQLAGLRNKIINGKMEIAQRGTSFVAAAIGAYTLDRWQPAGAGTDAVVTVSQQADVPASNEFQSSLRVAVTTADAAIAAGQAFVLSQPVEGYNARDLIGRTFTLSFWVRSSKTGVHCVSLRNSGSDRSYVAEYTINAANTWEQKSITVSGGLITGGTWDWTTGVGIVLRFALASGSTFHTTANAWQTGNFFTTSSQVNCLDTVGNIFFITGVQLEVGSVATPFEHRPYGLELALCQRYYYRLTAQSLGDSFGVGYVNSTTVASTVVWFPVVMRSAPTALEQSGTATDYSVIFAGSTIVNCSVVPAFSTASTSNARIGVTVASGLTAGQALVGRFASTNGYLGWSAEL